MVTRSRAALAAPAAPAAQQPTRRRRGIRNAREDRVFYALDYVLLTFSFLIVVYPLIYIVSSSFSDALEVMTGRVWLLPINPTLEGYQAVFEYRDVWIGYGNSIFYTVFGTIYNVAMTMIVAYPLSRKDFVGRSPIMFLFTFTMFFHGGLIPTYLLIRSLGMIDTRAVLIIPWAIAVAIHVRRPPAIYVRRHAQNQVPVGLLAPLAPRAPPVARPPRNQPVLFEEPQQAARLTHAAPHEPRHVTHRRLAPPLMRPLLPRPVPAAPPPQRHERRQQRVAQRPHRPHQHQHRSAPPAVQRHVAPGRIVAADQAPAPAPPALREVQLLERKEVAPDRLHAPAGIDPELFVEIKGLVVVEHLEHQTASELLRPQLRAAVGPHRQHRRNKRRPVFFAIGLTNPVGPSTIGIVGIHHLLPCPFAAGLVNSKLRQRGTPPVPASSRCDPRAGSFFAQAQPSATLPARQPPPPPPPPAAVCKAPRQTDPVDRLLLRRRRNPGACRLSNAAEPPRQRNPTCTPAHIVLRCSVA